MGVMAWGRSQNLSAGGLIILLGFPGPRGLHVGLFLLTYVRTGPGTWPSSRWSGHTGACRCPCAFPPATSPSWRSGSPRLRAQDAGRLHRAQRSHLLLGLRCAGALRLLSAAPRTPAGRMAYDRYPAVCLPLRCGSFLMSGLSGRLALGSWPWASRPSPCPRPSSAASPVARGSSTTSETLRPGSCGFCVILGSCVTTLGVLTLVCYVTTLGVLTLACYVTTLGVVTLVCYVTTLGVLTLVSYAHIVVALVWSPSSGRPRCRAGAGPPAPAPPASRWSSSGVAQLSSCT
nr:olfactory receptor 287-like [Ovis aries]